MSGERPRRWTVGGWPPAVAVCTVLGVMVVGIWLLSASSSVPSEPDSSGGDGPVLPGSEPAPTLTLTPDPSGSATPRPTGVGSKSPSESPSSSKSSTPVKEEEPEARPLTASVGAEGDWLGTYDGSATIANPNGSAVDGWTLVLTLHEGTTITGASGASYSQSGDTVTFTPSGNAEVPGNGEVSFSFSGTGTEDGYRSCTVNGNGC